MQITTGKAEALFFICGDQRLPIDTMFDIAGDLTDDPRMATSCVALLPDNRWIAINCKPKDIRLTKLN